MFNSGGVHRSVPRNGRHNRHRRRRRRRRRRNSNSSCQGYYEYCWL